MIYNIIYMFKNSKLLILTITAVLLFSILMPSNALSIGLQEREPIFNYDSKLSLEINETVVENPLAIDKTTSVDASVEFSTDIPSFFLNTRIGRLIVFKSFTAPTAEVELSVIDEPEDCEIKIEPTKIKLEFNEEPQKANFSILIAPTKDAIAEPYQITINAKFNSSSDWNLESFNISETLVFTPQYYASINVEFDEEQNLTSGKETLIPINITNKGNKQSIVRIKHYINDSLAPVVTPAELDLDIGETDQIMLSVTADDDFDTEIIPIEFIVFSAPISGSDEGTNTTYYLKLVSEKSDSDDGDFINEDLLFLVFIALIIVLAVFLLIWYIKRR